MAETLIDDFLKKSSTHLVQLDGQLALLSVGGILCDNTLSDSLVNLLDSNLICFGGCSLITGLDGGVKLLDEGLELGLQHFILHGLGFGDQNSLLGRFDIGHGIHLLIFVFKCLNILTPFYNKIKYFFKKETSFWHFAEILKKIYKINAKCRSFCTIF